MERISQNNNTNNQQDNDCCEYSLSWSVFSYFLPIRPNNENQSIEYRQENIINTAFKSKAAAALKNLTQKKQIKILPTINESNDESEEIDTIESAAIDNYNNDHNLELMSSMLFCDFSHIQR